MTYLKQIAKEKNLTQKDIAKIINKSQSTVSKYMIGTILPDIETYIILSNYFNCSLDELLGIKRDTVSINRTDYNELLKFRDLFLNTIKEK